MTAYHSSGRTLITLPPAEAVVISGSVNRGVSSHPHYVVKQEQPTNRLYIAMSFLELLGTAQNCLKLLGASRGCSGLLGLLVDVQRCSEIFEAARSCSELLGAARSCSELLRAAQSCSGEGFPLLCITLYSSIF